MKTKTVLEIINAALGAIYDLEDGGESTGTPSYRGQEVDVERGLRRLAFRSYYRGRGAGYYVVLRRGAARVRLPFA